MADQLVQTTRTTAALRATDGLSKESVGVLWSQFCAETGKGVYCWNWNLGNVKHVQGDGHDYVSLKGVWEGVTPTQAEKLIATGNWLPDPSADHAKAVGPGMVSVMATANNSATWFRAFESLNDGMSAHVSFLSSTRWLPAWQAVLSGDLVLFSKRLKAAGYYSASEASYTKQLHEHFVEYMATTQWEQAIALLKDEGASAADWPDQPIIHPPIDFDPPDDSGEGNV